MTKFLNVIFDRKIPPDVIYLIENTTIMSLKIRFIRFIMMEIHKYLTKEFFLIQKKTKIKKFLNIIKLARYI